MRIRTAAVLCALVFASALPAVASDLTIVSKVTTTAPGMPGSPGPTTSTMYMTPSAFKTSDAQHDTIFEIESGRMVMVDHAKKEYWEMTRADMEAMAQKMNDQMKQMQNNPQAAQAMQAMMGGAAGDVTVQKGTSPRTIAGYRCDQYILSMGPMMRMEIWAAADLTTPVSLAKLFDARSALMQMNPMFKRMTPMMEEMKKVKGVALAEATTVSMGSMKIETNSEAIEVKTSAIPASVFEIPSGYTKVESPMKQMGRMGR